MLCNGHFLHDWISKLYPKALGKGPEIGFADAIDAGKMIEMRLAKRFLEGYLSEQVFSVRLSHFTRNWKLEDETDWITLRGGSGMTHSSGFEILDCGSLATDATVTMQGERSIVGEYRGSGRYTPYLRTDPKVLSLTPQSRYQVCFDYRIIDTSPEGFEVLFYSQAGSRDGNWVPPLRLHGTDGKLGCGCLEVQLHDYTDYEIRWNVASTGKIVIDNVVVRNLETNETIAEEDFEDWK